MSTQSLAGYKVLVSYNYSSGKEMAYRRFMVSQWLPAVQALGLEPLQLFHVMWGAYPIRLIVLYAEDKKILKQALRSQEWALWLQRLENYVEDLRYCVVKAQPWLQLCEPG